MSFKSEPIMNVQTLRELLHRLDNQQIKQNKLSSVTVSDIGWYEGNIKFRLQITLNSCQDVFNFPQYYYDFDTVSLWNNYSNLTSDYKEHVWLSLMEFIDYQILCLEEQNDEDIVDY